MGCCMERQIYRIYCDESCHLPNDNSDVMVLGALSCPESKIGEISEKFREIKRIHGLDSKVELKWTKISPAKVELYEELLNFFWHEESLAFRTIVSKGKQRLDHTRYNDGDYDLWYYKMYFLLLDKMCSPLAQYRIFIDVKDTHGGPRIAKLHEVLCNNKYDFKQDVIADIRQIDSARSDLMQLVDILTGAISFYHRGLYVVEGQSIAKKRAVAMLLEWIGDKLDKGTPLRNQKFNLFVWNPKGGE